MYQHIEKGRKAWDFNSVSAVIAVILIITLEYYAFMFVFAAHLFDISPGLGALVYIKIHLFILIMAWSYYKVITTGPGYLSEGINDTFSNVDEIKERQKLMLRYKYAKNQDNPHRDPNDHSTSQNTEDLEANTDHQEIRRIATNPILLLQEVGYCFKCKRVKIPRAHHCKQCAKCVVRMDHHCPWTGNCIGLYNHKFFVLFLVYAFALIFQIFLWQCFIYIPNSMNYKAGISQTENAILQVSLIASAGLALAIGFLMGYQLYVTAKNLTTVEHHIPTITERNPFDKGVLRNFEEIFGTDHRTWFWPVEPKLRSEEDLFLSKSY